MWVVSMIMNVITERSIVNRDKRITSGKVYKVAILTKRLSPEQTFKVSEDAEVRRYANSYRLRS